MNKIVIPSNLVNRSQVVAFINSKITDSMKKKTKARRELEDLKIIREIEKEDTYQ